MLTASEIQSAHSHVVDGSVRFDTTRNKQVCTIKTRGIDGQFDGNTRELATSDLHQTFWTVETKKALDKLKAKAKRANKRAAKATSAAIDSAEAPAAEQPAEGMQALRELAGTPE